MNNVLKSMRLHIGIFGKRNVGKSSILNFLTGQNASIVSDVAGTTTDAVEKTMELIPLGPVVFIDTAGVDDVGELGQQRIEKTFASINRIDVALKRKNFALLFPMSIIRFNGGRFLKKII